MDATHQRKSFLEQQAEMLESWARTLEEGLSKSPLSRVAQVFASEARALRHAAECFRCALAAQQLPKPIDNVFFDLIGEVEGKAEHALDFAQGQVVAIADFYENVSVYPPEAENGTLREVAARLQRAAGQRT